MTFTITRLANQQALISGTDKLGVEGKTVVSTARYDEVRRELTILGAEKVFDSKVEEMFAPIIAAAEEFNKAKAIVPVQDPASFVVVREGSEGASGEASLTLRFDADGTVLNLIENGDEDRLVWMGDRLLVTEYVPSDEPGPTLAEAQALVAEVLGGEEVQVNGAGVEDGVTPRDADLS